MTQYWLKPEAFDIALTRRERSSWLHLVNKPLEAQAELGFKTLVDLAHREPHASCAWVHNTLLVEWGEGPTLFEDYAWHARLIQIKREVRKSAQARLHAKFQAWEEPRAGFRHVESPHIIFDRGVLKAKGKALAVELSKLRAVRRQYGQDSLEALQAEMLFQRERFDVHRRYVPLLSELSERGHYFRQNEIVCLLKTSLKPVLETKPALARLHYLHQSETQPDKVAFYPDMEKFRARKCVVTTLGRYLTRHYKLEEKDVKYWAEWYNANFGPVDLKWATSPEEIVHAIGNGPSESCMSNGYHDDCEGEWYRGHVHPAAVYGSLPGWETNFGVAYIENDDEITARVICNMETKECARIYGDDARMRKALALAGFKQAQGALLGMKVRKIENRNGSGFIMPYIDAGIASGGGALHVMDYDDRYWVTKEDDEPADRYQTFDTYEGYAQKGVICATPQKTCACCGEEFDEDDLTYSEYEEEHLCNACIEDNYVTAYIRRNITDLVHRDHAVYCKSDWEWYSTRYAGEVLAQCEVTSDFYFESEVVDTPEGMMHRDLVVDLDEDYNGFDFARESATCTTHDGRVIYYLDAVTVERNNEEFILHKDDDPDDYLDAEDESGEVEEGEIGHVGQTQQANPVVETEAAIAA